MNTSSQRLEWALKRCEESRLRLTRSRRVLLGSLASQSTPVTLARLQELNSGLCDLATAYRAIRVFESAGIVRRVKIQPRHSSYALLTPDEDLSYLACRDCGRVRAVEGVDMIREMLQNIGELSGYIDLHHDLEFIGTCPACHQWSATGLQHQPAVLS